MPQSPNWGKEVALTLLLGLVDQGLLTATFSMCPLVPQAILACHNGTHWRRDDSDLTCGCALQQVRATEDMALFVGSINNGCVTCAAVLGLHE